MIIIRLIDTEYLGNCIYPTIPKYIEIVKNEQIDGITNVWVEDISTFLKLTRDGR